MNVFSRIYQRNEWNGIETRSGPGSHREPTRRVAAAIVQLVDWLGVESVLDFGCGEGLWMPDLPGYVGIDVAPEAIEAAERNHPDRSYMQAGTKFQVKAYELTSIWEFDLIICRDVVQHLSLADGLDLVRSIQETHRGYLLASTYVGTENIDIKTGDAYRPNLEAEPFNLPPALLLIHDGYEYHDGDTLRDPGKMLGLWRL